MIDNNILLIGAGPMAIEYAKVLYSLNIKFKVVGRGHESAEIFFKHTKVNPIPGGLEKYLLKNNKNIETVIIATGTNSLMNNLLLLLKNGYKKILIEKPAAIKIDQLINNENEILKYKSDIFVAYNRRFLDSIIEVKKIIKYDGGLQSMFFEFTEWLHLIEKIENKEEKENLFFVNSTHIIDLAFFLAGKPIKWNAYTKKGNVDWHPNTQFCGSGITNKNVLFSYLSNWESAGRWSIELFTNKRRIYLKPIEKIFIQNKGEISLNEHQFSISENKNLKEGLQKQVHSFLTNDFVNLLNIREHIINTKEIYKKILNK